MINTGRHRLALARGFTLLEILVSIIILSIGAIAVLGLLTASVKSGVDAKYQSVALQFASDLSEMMKSNATVASLKDEGNPYLIDKIGSGTASNLTPFVGADTAKALAERDIKDWYYQLSKQLPASRAVVCFDKNPYDANGLAQWSCSDEGTLYIKIGWSLRNKSKGNNTLDLDRPNVVIPVGVCNPIDNNAQVACISGNESSGHDGT